MQNETRAAQAKHTPGPWNVVNENQNERRRREIHSNNTGQVVALVLPTGAPAGGRDPGGAERDANAQLIAAAPALADALAGMLADVEAWLANPGGHSPTSKIAAAHSALRAAGRLP